MSSCRRCKGTTSTGTNGRSTHTSRTCVASSATIPSTHGTCSRSSASATSSARNEMRRSFALRLVAAFAGVGIAAAGITAILVNLLFASRFTSYLESQQQQSQNELVAALSASYRRSGGWDPADLRSLEALALSEGGTMQLLGPDGQVEWNPSAGPAGQMATVHRKMMGNPPLGPATPLPIVVEGSRVGTAVVREPTIGVLPQDVAFRSSVNRTLLLGGVVAAVGALSLGLVLARRATAPARERPPAARP